MATKTKTRDIVIIDKAGTFDTILKKVSTEKENYDFEALSALRRLLSNEKARLLNTIKVRKPGSIYELAKNLKRDFKSVSEDLKLLQRFGFIEYVSEKTGKRERLKPILTIDTLNIQIKI